MIGTMEGGDWYEVWMVMVTTSANRELKGT